MSALETFNDSGSLQFSADLMQYYLKTKGTVTLNYLESTDYIPEAGGAPGAGALVYKEDSFSSFVTVQSDEFIAYSCANPIFSATGAPASGLGAFRSHTNGAVVTYYIFAPFREFTPPGNFGFQLFNSDTSLAFDLLAKPMVRVARYAIGTTSSGMDTALGLPGGRTYAAYLSKTNVRQTSTFIDYFPPPSFTAANYNGCEVAFRMSGGDIRLTESNNTTYTVGDQYDAYLNVLDVTGY